MQVVISQPAKSSMQSGRGNSKRWMLSFEPTSKREIEPLMGWTSSADTKQQVALWFDSMDEAVSYAQKQGYLYSVVKPTERKVTPKAYADNFANNRILRWTH